jgi:hypothetical protein
MATSASTTSPDYYAAAVKNLQPSAPGPVNKGPYLDQAGQVPVQSVMSNADFGGSMGPNWEAFSKPGGYLDKFYQGQTQINDPNGNNMTIADMTKALSDAGKTFTPNPYLAIPTLQSQLYQNTDKNVAGYYDQLSQALGAGRQDYEQRSAAEGQKIGGYFDQAGQDVQQFGQGRVNANQDFANSIGLGQTTGVGSQTSNLQDQLARLGAINATNKGNAQATFDQRRGIIDDLLQQRALSSAVQGTQSRDALAEMAQQHWGLADPNQLYEQYMATSSSQDLAKQQQEIALATLQNQLAALQTGGAGGSGGGGGGGGGKGGGGKKGGGSSSAASSVNPSGIQPSDLWGPLSKMTDDPNAGTNNVNDPLMLAQYYYRKANPGQGIGQKSNTRTATAK